jgi:hypothetical protein
MQDKKQNNYSLLIVKALNTSKSVYNHTTTERGRELLSAIETAEPARNTRIYC